MQLIDYPPGLPDGDGEVIFSFLFRLFGSSRRLARVSSVEVHLEAQVWLRAREPPGYSLSK